MKIKELTYKRKFWLGGYSTEEIGIGMEVEEGEKGKEVLDKMRKFVHSQALEQVELEKQAKAQLATSKTKGSDALNAKLM